VFASEIQKKKPVQNLSHVRLMNWFFLCHFPSIFFRSVCRRYGRRRLCSLESQKKKAKVQKKREAEPH